jgi:sugar lactone lactonase YvrE
MKSFPCLPVSSAFRRSISTRIFLIGFTVAIAGIILPPTAIAQSVTLAGSQSTVPITGLHYENGVAVDKAGNLFVSDTENNRIVELPRTPTGTGPQVTLPTNGLSEPEQVAIDSAGNVFIADFLNDRIVELPKTTEGYGTQITLPAGGLSNPWGVAVDDARDVFIADTDNNRVLELPWTGSGYGAQTVLATAGLSGPTQITLDSAGDLFIADSGNARVVELPATTGGFGAQLTLPATGLSYPAGVAVDNLGDVFIGDVNGTHIIELPKTSTGYGPQIKLLPDFPNSPEEIAIDSNGNLFVASISDSHVFEWKTRSVDFGSVNLCATGQTTPAPCSETLSLTYNITGSGTLGPIEAVTLGAPNFDFTLASGSTCTGAVTKGDTCVVNVQFAPLYAGVRRGGVLLKSTSGKLLTKTLIYGFGSGPQVGFIPSVPTTVASGFNNSLTLEAGDAFEIDGFGNIYLGIQELGRSIGLGNGELPGGAGAVDGAGDILVPDIEAFKVVEFPVGGGSAFDLPLGTGWTNPISHSVTVDGAGDVFVVGSQVIELKTDGSLAEAENDNDDLYSIGNAATDYAGDLFVQGRFTLAKIPPGCLTADCLTTIPIASPNGFRLFAMDGVGNFFGQDGNFFGQDSTGSILEVPAVGGTPATIATGFTNLGGIGFDLAGDLLASDSSGTGQIVMLQSSQPPVLNFGSVPLGSTTSLPLTIVNSGTGALTFSPSIDNPSYEIATPEESTCLTGIAAAQSCTLQVQFSASAAGPQNGILTLHANAASSPSVSLVGTVTAATGLAPPVFGVPQGAYPTGQLVSITDAVPSASIRYTTDGTTPTATSALYTDPVPVSSSETLEAVAFLPGSPSSSVAEARYNIGTDFSTGFSAGTIQLNGSAAFSGTSLELTDGQPNEAGSAFYKVPLSAQGFSTDFTFQLTDAAADGFTFTIQSDSPTALGSLGGSLGYRHIANGLAIKFDLFDNDGEGADSTGLYINGAAPDVPSVDLTGTGIDLHSGDPISAHVQYGGATLELVLTDLVTKATWSHEFPIDIGNIAGFNPSAAYIGFTGGTGGRTAIQRILSWTYQSGIFYSPAFYSGSGLNLVGSASVSGNVLNLTDGGKNEVAAAWYSTPQNIQSFTTDFDFQLTHATADGFTFTIQSLSPTAIGTGGGGLGFKHILGDCVGIKFDLYNDAGEGSDSTGIYYDGASPDLPSVDLSGTGIDLHSSHLTHAHMSYDGTTLTLTLTDSVTMANWTHGFTVDLPQIVGYTTAYVGFTAGTGSSTAVQQILDWTFE